MPNFAGYPSAVISGSPGKTARIQGLATNGPPPFNPLDIPDFVGWWDSTEGVMPGGDGQPVTQWDDKSGNGNHIAQSVASLRPVLDSSGPIPIVVFDGVDDSLFIADFDSGEALQPNTYFIVGNLRTLEGFTFSTIMDSRSTPSRQSFFETGANWEMFAGTSPVIQPANTGIHVFVCIFNSVDSMFYEDGGMATTIDSGTRNMIGLTLGASRTQSNGAPWNALDLIMYKVLLDTSELNQVGQFFADKHGLTWNPIIP